MARRLRPRPWQEAIAKKNQRLLLRLIQEQDVAVQKAVRQALRDALSILDGLPGDTVGPIVRRSFYEQRRAALGDLATSFWTDLGQVAISNAGTASQVAMNANLQVLSTLTRGVGPGRAGILADSFLASARRTHIDLRSRLLNSIDLAPSVYRNQAFMRGTIDRIVNNGILLGQSADEIGKGVRQYINPRTPGGVRYAAHRLGRTELNNAFHTSSSLAYAESPFVEGVLWNLSGSHPKPDECNSYSDENSYDLGVGIFPRESIPPKPHPQCFCFLTAVTPDIDDFLRRMKQGEYDCASVL